ncbi:MAG: hypothetical protein R3E76_16385 [Planctomycetota bacterium]
MAQTRPFVCAFACLLMFAAALEAQQAPTANEMAFIYELNRARQNPQRYDTENSLGGILNGVAAQPPLALNENLVQSARFHSTEMATAGYFAHQSAVTGDYPNKMARDAGYPLYTGWTDNANYIESLAANGGSFSGVTYSPTDALRNLIIDAGVTPPGHRIHLLAMDPFNQDFREIGTGYAQGAHWSNSSPWSAAYWAIHTGRRNTDPIRMFGVVYDDANGNGRYDSGEGLGGVTVNATGPSTQNTTTNAQGAYVLVVTSGSWTVTCSGGSFQGTSNATVSVGSNNVEVDFASGRPAGERDFEFQSVGGGPVLTTAPGTLTFNSPTAATPSTSDSFTISGVRLVGDVTITAPSEFQVSTQSGTGFGNSVTLTPGGATLATTTVYVRFNPSGASGANGDVTCTADGAISKLINVTGTVSTNPAVFASPATLALVADRIGVSSNVLSYTLSGYNLTASIAISAPGDFEVSLSSTSGFSGGFSIAPSGGTVSPTTIYVRYMPGSLSDSGNITNVAGAASDDVAVTGTVTNAPQISVSTSTLTFVSASSGVPSTEQVVNVSGQYLAGDIVVTAPSGFELTTTSGSAYTASVNLTPAAGVVTSTPIYVRYLGGTPSSGNLTCTSTQATTQQVALTGSIAPPPNITLGTGGLTLNSTAIGVTSPVSSYTVSGTNLVGNVSLNCGSGFEISTSASSGFGTSLSLTPAAGTLTATTIYVRYTPTVATQVIADITHSSPAATSKLLPVWGNVVAPGSGSSGSGSDSGGGCVSAGTGTPGLPWLLLLALAVPVLCGLRLKLVRCSAPPRKP